MPPYRQKFGLLQVLQSRTRQRMDQQMCHFLIFSLTAVAATDSVFVVSFFYSSSYQTPEAPSDRRVYFSILAPHSILIPFTLYHQNKRHPVN